MNSRIRQLGYSAHEVWTKRDLITGESIDIDDAKLIEQKYQCRKKQHAPSAKYKARGRTKESLASVTVGEIVYLYQDRDKTKGRDMYMIMKVLEDDYCNVQKLVNHQFRGKPYKVHLTNIIKVPVQIQSSESDTDDSLSGKVRDKVSIVSDNEVDSEESSCSGNEAESDDKDDTEVAQPEEERVQPEVREPEGREPQIVDEERIPQVVRRKRGRPRKVAQPEVERVQPEVERAQPRRVKQIPAHFKGFEMGSP